MPDDDLATLGKADVLVPRYTSDIPSGPTVRSAMLAEHFQQLSHPRRAQVPSLSGPHGQALEAASTQRVLLAGKCRDVRQDVVIESGLQGHADVFSDGRIASAWAPVSAASPASNFVLPAAEQVAVFVMRTGQVASMTRPSISVSDPSILSVELAKKVSKDGIAAAADGDPVVLVSKHFCKTAGVATVTIELPLQKKEAAVTPIPFCAGQPAPVVLSYQKTCAPQSHALGDFMKAFSLKLPERDKLLALSRSRDGPPWKGIIPTGGARTVLLVSLILGLSIVMYEFGLYWFGHKIKKALIDMGPVMFGCEATVDHVALSFWGGHLTYTLKGLHFANPPGGDWQNPTFMNITEVKVWINVYLLVTTFAQVIEIRQLVVRHIQANVEVDGYLYGQSNISTVLAQMEKNNKKFVSDLEHIKATHGIDAAKIWGSVNSWIKRQMERVTLKEVVIEGISYSASTKSLGMEMAIADMDFHDFSEQHNATGVTAIAYFLTHAVLEGMAEDLAGVELGHGRFEGLINSFKSLTGKA
jgi:hypothetical protein